MIIMKAINHVIITQKYSILILKIMADNAKHDVHIMYLLHQVNAFNNHD